MSLTWRELKAKINELTDNQLDRPAALFDSDNGELVGIDGLGPVNDWAEGYNRAQICLSLSCDEIEGLEPTDEEDNG